MLSDTTKGILTVIGGCFLQLLLGNLFLWGFIGIYVTSYYRIIDNDEITTETTNIAFPAIIIGIILTMSPGIFLSEKFGAKITILIPGILCCLIQIVISYLPTFWLFFIFFGGFFGFCLGPLYMIPIHISCKYFFEKKGSISGIITGFMGISPVLTGNLAFFIINPNNLQPTLKDKHSNEYYFDWNVSKNVSLYFKVMSVYLFLLVLIGTLLTFDKKIQKTTVNPSERKSSSSIVLSLHQNYALNNDNDNKNEDEMDDGDKNSKTKEDNNEIEKYLIEKRHHYFELQQNKETQLQNKFIYKGLTNEENEEIISKECPTVNEAIRTKAFWVLFGIGYCGSLFGYFLAVNFKNIYKYDDKFLTIVGSIGNIANGVFRIVWGLLFDKIGFKAAMRINLAIVSAMILGIAFLSHIPILFSIMVLMTLLCLGGMYPIFPAECINLFGITKGAQIAGNLYICMIGSNFSQFFIILVLKNSIGMTAIFMIFFVICIIGFLLNEFTNLKYEKKSQ